MNLLLWGGCIWSGNKKDVTKIEVFQNKAMCRTLGITMLQVKEYRITNEEIRTTFNNVPKEEGTLAAFGR